LVPRNALLKFDRRFAAVVQRDATDSTSSRTIGFLERVASTREITLSL
jgi:hypothetical protein